MSIEINTEGTVNNTISSTSSDAIYHVNAQPSNTDRHFSPERESDVNGKDEDGFEVEHKPTAPSPMGDNGTKASSSLDLTRCVNNNETKVQAKPDLTASIANKEKMDPINGVSTQQVLLRSENTQTFGGRTENEITKMQSIIEASLEPITEKLQKKCIALETQFKSLESRYHRETEKLEIRNNKLQKELNSLRKSTDANVNRINILSWEVENPVKIIYWLTSGIEKLKRAQPWTLHYFFYKILERLGIVPLPVNTEAVSQVEAQNSPVPWSVDYRSRTGGLSCPQHVTGYQPQKYTISIIYADDLLPQLRTVIDDVVQSLDMELRRLTREGFTIFKFVHHDNEMQSDAVIVVAKLTTNRLKMSDRQIYGSLNAMFGGGQGRPDRRHMILLSAAQPTNQSVVPFDDNNEMDGIPKNHLITRNMSTLFMSGTKEKHLASCDINKVVIHDISKWIMDVMSPKLFIHCDSRHDENMV